MAITKVYTRINWEDYPSVNTAVSAKNLNNMDYTINRLDDEMVELDSKKAEQSTVLGMVQNWEMDENTGIITVTKLDGSKMLFDLNIEKIPVQFSLSDAGILTMTTEDGTKYTADIGKMIPVLVFQDSGNIGVNVTGTGSNKTYSFFIKGSSVTIAELHPEVLAEINKAEGNALLSKSYASGGTGVRDGENTDNSNYYKDQASDYASQAYNFSLQAGQNSQHAGAYATQAGGYASQAEATLSACTEHISNKSNPHGTDKTDVGLGNVPNVTTNNQTPTYSQASSRTNLVSGEKLSVSLGKIMKWFYDLKSHAFSSPVNNLASTSSTTALAAAQGKALNDKIEAIPTITFSASEPTTVAANTIVMVYE